LGTYNFKVSPNPLILVLLLKAIIFDLFGTLITADSDRVAHEALAKALSEMHHNAFSWREHMELYDKFVDHGLSSLDATWKALLELLSKTGLRPSVGKDELSRMHADFHGKYAKLRPDALEALRKAREAVDKLGLLTDGDREIVHTIVENTGIRRFFDAIVTFDDCSARKPDPRLFLTCLRRLDVDPAYAVMIGDRCVDIEGSIRVGMKAVLLGNAEGCSVKPHAEVSSLLEAVDKALALLDLR